MSRNLCQTNCHECPGGSEHIVIEEAPRPITEEEAGIYHEEYTSSKILFAKAHCKLCEAQYLAWFGFHRHRLDAPIDPDRHDDLSYRAAFNDEHGGVADRRQWEVKRVVTYTRVRRIEWCPHGHRESHEPVDKCHDCRREAQLAEVPEKYAWFVRRGSRWEPHFNSPIYDRPMAAVDDHETRRFFRYCDLALAQIGLGQCRHDGHDPDDCFRTAVERFPDGREIMFKAEERPDR